MKKFLLFSLIITLTFSCNDNYESRMASENIASYDEERLEYSTNSRSQSGTEVPQEIVDNRKKIIKEGNIDIEVVDIERAKHRVDSILKVSEGYYSKESYVNNHYRSYFDLRLRIPNSKYESFISVLEQGGGKILSKNIDAKDVTDQFTDIETRLKNKRNYLERYRDLVKKANTIKEILEVEEKIRVLEEEIDSAEGRLRFLSDQVAYSTLTLRIYGETQKYEGKKETFIDSVIESLSWGWESLVNVFLVLIKLWPFLIVFSIIAYFLVKKQKRKDRQ